jgi:hypothetical protein
MAIGPTGAAVAPFVLSAIWLAAVSTILTGRVGSPRTIPSLAAR